MWPTPKKIWHQQITTREITWHRQSFKRRNFSSELTRRLQRNVEQFKRQCFERSVKICEPLNIEIKKHRTCGRQLMRDNVRAEGPEDYFRKSITVPFLDYTLNEMTTRQNRFGTTVGSIYYWKYCSITDPPSKESLYPPLHILCCDLVLLFFSPASCVPCAASFSGLSFFDCFFGIL
jgi:hypothetical protein